MRKCGDLSQIKTWPMKKGHESMLEDRDVWYGVVPGLREKEKN